MGGGGRGNTRINRAVLAKKKAPTPIATAVQARYSDPVVNLPVKSVVQPAPEEFASLASPFETTADPYSSWFSETERGQRSDVTTTPDLFSPESFGMTAEELTAAKAKRDADNEAALARITPEQMARLEAMDLSGLSGGFTGRISGGLFGNTGQMSNPASTIGTYARENQYNNITAYNPLGTAPEDMVVYDDLNSPEAKAAKASREAELSKDLQSWSDPLKKLSKTDPAKFGEEYSSLPLTGQLAYLRNEFDNGEMGEREYQDAFAQQWNASGNAGTLQFIDKYGWRMYAPDAIAQQGGQDPNGPQAWYETEGLFDGSIDRLDQFTPRVKETFDPTSIGRGLLAEPIIRGFAAIATKGMSEGYIAAGKGLTGDTLHASDWLSIANTGLQLGGALTAPVDAAAAADAGTAAMQAADAAGLSNTASMAAGTAAQTAAAAGKGLTIAGKTLSYNQSMGLLTAAATGDPKQAIGQIFGADLVKGGLGKIGVTVDTVGDVQYNAVSQGLNTVVNKVAAGEDLDKALASGLVTYVKEDGTRGSIDLGGSLGLDVSGLKKVVEDLVRPIGAIATDFAHFVEDAVPVEAIKKAGSEFDDAVLQPAKGLAEEGASIAGDVLSVVDDEVIQPVIQGVEEGASVAGDVLSAADTAVRDAASAFDDAVIQPIGDAFSDLDTAVRQALPDINGPDIDLPDVNLPDIDLNLPDFNMPSFGLGDMGMVMGLMTPQANATTNKLFENELFKFKTEVGITDREELIDIEDFLTSTFSSSFDQQQRF